MAPETADGGRLRGERLARAGAALAPLIGADSVTLSNPQLLSGGAIQENWSVEAEVAGGPRAGTHRWVLRTDSASGVATSHGRAQEFALLRTGQRVGMTVAEPIALCEDNGPIGAPFFVMQHVAGVAQARRVVRDPAVESFGPAVAHQLGRELALLHRILPGDTRDLDFLPVPDQRPSDHRVAQYRRYLDEIGATEPALEYALTWLAAHAPADQALVLCHCDYRTGNYMVDVEGDGRLTAVLDWEFAGWSDRHEDIAWFCAACWRFGAVEREAGGIAPRQAFYDGYQSVDPRPIDDRAIAYWEIMAAVRWAVIALQQGARAAGDPANRLELALTGMMAPELTHEALVGIEDYVASWGHGQ